MITIKHTVTKEDVKDLIERGYIITIKTFLETFTIGLSEKGRAFNNNLPYYSKSYDSLDDLLFSVFFKYRAKDMQYIRIVHKDDPHITKIQFTTINAVKTGR